MKTAFKSIAAAAMLAIPSVLSAQVNIIGTTLGCFYQGPLGGQCSAGSSPTSIGGLTFTGSTFDVTVGPSGTVEFGNALNNLGSFSLTDQAFNYDGYNFRLFITFVSPATNPGGVNVLAELEGRIRTGGSGEVEIEFDDNFRTFSYDGGSFQFAVEEEIEIKKNQTKYVGFEVKCGKNGGTCGPSTQVPEPATLSLVAAGLIGLVGAARRRHIG